MQRRIGIRDAKARLSSILREVRQGVEWIITDRDQPVARIVPMQQARDLSLEERLRRMEERGLVERKRDGSKPLPPPLPVPGELARKWLDEDRDR
ncbi:MAG TPA: type II toxin-antitoxin system prevent-host-death family antitoxin [Bacillota bacterium]